MKIPLKTTLILALLIPACGIPEYVGDIFATAQDPAIVELGETLRAEKDKYEVLYKDYEGALDEMQGIRASLANDGLTIDNTEAALNALMSTTARIGTLQVALAETGNAIEVVKKTIEDKEKADGTPWWVTALGIILAGTSPTWTAIPVVSRLMNSRFVAKGLEGIGLRDESKRAESRTYKGPGDLAKPS